MAANLRLAEAHELSKPTSEYSASPLDGNIFEWHFTIRGPENTPYAGGMYHGRIIFPTAYPIKPPEIIFLTPNGRFETNVKICLSASNYHPEQWRPIWGGLLPTPPEGAIGATNVSEIEKVRLALVSPLWSCPVCGKCNRELLAEVDVNESLAVAAEAKSLQTQLTFTTQAETDESIKENTDPLSKPKIPIDVPKSSATESQELPYPWKDRFSVAIDGSYIRRLRPSLKNGFPDDLNRQYELSMPLYDWEQEEKDNPIIVKPTPPTNVENSQGTNFIPNTRIQTEHAFSLAFHLTSLLMLIVLLILVYLLGKRLFFVLSQFLKDLTEDS